ALLATGDAAGSGNGRVLPRDARRLAAPRMARSEPPHRTLETAQAVAGVAPRAGMTASGRVHIVGAGIAGLAAAVRLMGESRSVALYEATEHAGGRCRSFFDNELGCRIDNGNHLLLAGNSAALAYIERIGALGTFERPAEAAGPFIYLEARERGGVRAHARLLPWWAR